MRCGLRLLALNLLWLGGSPLWGQSFATNTYTPSDEDLANPERGFYVQASTSASSPSAVPSTLAGYRINGKWDPNHTYNAKISLVLRLFYLDSFISAPISSNFLASIQTDFNSIRGQGCKAIVRFAYSQKDTRPFDEPTKAQILAHIEQLKPLLQQNADVIAVLQQGLIGAWGEGYYTDFFFTNGQATPQNWLDRAEVAGALLAALPAQRMVQMRTPQYKQKYVYGITATSSSVPLAAVEAFSGSAAARLGFHNDCYLASSTDFGTFSDYDSGSGTTTQETANFRNYVAADSRYVPVGGETCALNPPTDDCASAGGGADTDMALSHYSFLNLSYNAAVNDDWAAQGCIDSIKRRLGYRLQLLSGVFRTEARPGQAIPLTLCFQNTGFAAPFNPRGLELIFRHATSGQKFYAELSRDTDVRRWLPGTNYTLNTSLSLPSDLPPGAYDLLLHLPDPALSLYGQAAYSIHLANSNALSSAGAVLGDLWDPVSGYHRLRQTLTVNATATNAAPTGSEILVTNYSVFNGVPVAFVDPAQPADQTLTAGQPARFSAAVIGSAPLQFQWYKDGAAIAGATTSAYTIDSVQSGDAGGYVLGVSNPFSTNSSRSAQLTVLAPPARTIMIDGAFDDWQGLPPVYSSPSNSPLATNLKDLYLCHDSDFIYVMVTAWSPTVLVSSYNNFYFDTDNNPNTGYASMGGSELLLQNGAGYQQKAGVFNAGAVTNLQLACAPSGTAGQFEFRLSRQAAFASDGAAVFRTNVIHFCFDAENTSYVTVNRVPAAGSVAYTLTDPALVLSVGLTNAQLTLQWPGSAVLQTRSSLTTGLWTTTGITVGPWTTPATGAQQFFRLAK